jgi:hypothetical protein
MLKATYDIIPDAEDSRMTDVETEVNKVLDLDIADSRDQLGRMWGLGRSLSRAELARALALSPVHGGSHVSKLELPKDNPRRATLTGPIAVAIRMMLNGAVPATADSIVKPGYPRGGKH